MDWLYCIEVVQPSCILKMSAIGLVTCRDRMEQLVNEIQVTDALSLARKMTLQSQVPLLCRTCQWFGSYETDSGTKGKSDVLHSLVHLVLGGDFADVMASPNDVGPFIGYHGNM